MVEEVRMDAAMAVENCTIIMADTRSRATVGVIEENIYLLCF